MNKINNDGTFKPVGGANNVKNATPSKKESSVDAAQFSQHLNTASPTSKMPVDEARALRISELKRQIQSGEYKVDHKKVALSLLKNLSGLKS